MNSNQQGPIVCDVAFVIAIAQCERALTMVVDIISELLCLKYFLVNDIPDGFNAFIITKHIG